MSDVATGSAASRPFDRRALTYFAIPMAILTILGWIGDALAPTLLDKAPLFLLVCNPRLRNLVLVSPHVDFVPFVLVAAGRLVISDPLFYWFGRRYGDGAIRWMERRLGPGASPVLWAERLFRKAAWPALAVMPNNMICLLAGATGMPVAGFVVVNVAGTMVRILGVRLIGRAFSDPILAINDWIGEHRLVLTAITFGITMIVIGRSMRQGRDPIETTDEMARDLEAPGADTEGK
jgi:membrane protein DedA with SNARE-associated domain